MHLCQNSALVLNIPGKIIFSTFHRLHTKKDYKGTGIGLALCQKIVQNHHGEIYAHAEPGKGSSCVVILPEKQLKRQ